MFYSINNRVMSNNFTKVRQSNIELLRIVSMFLVVMTHANLSSIGYPTVEELSSKPFPAGLRILFAQFSVICVNLFVLISGWFGINVKCKSIITFLFQWLFFAVLLMTFYPFLQGSNILSFPKLTYQVISMNRLWFVPSYIVLYLSAPILNAFVERSNKLQFKVILIAFFSFEFIFGWLLNGANDIFMGGSSPLSFAGLYLLARYIRIYPPYNVI